MTLIPCPSCGRQVSNQATACPQCGHPIKTKSKIAQDVEDAKKAAAWLAFLILLPSLTVPTIISTLLNPGKLTEAGLSAIWNTFILTAPLTASIALIGVLATSLTENEFDRPKAVFYTVVFSSIPILWFSAWFSQSMLHIQGVDVGKELGASWEAVHHRVYGKPGIVMFIILIILKVLLNYFTLYGFWNFASSFAIGTFLIWVWVKKIYPYMKS